MFLRCVVRHRENKKRKCKKEGIKILLFLFIFNLLFNNTFSQPTSYLKEEQYEKFFRRRILVANWQVHQLADSGALVVRLKSNKKSIELLLKNNQISQARGLQQSTFELNKKIVQAFTHHYHFSKVYFIYDYSSDSLLRGYRNGIFLDTTLQRNNAIYMNEKFYLIAEKDFVVQSSIGFVPEEIASRVTETGAPVKQVAIVIKNKYGHQLKRPFPYYVKGTNSNKYNLYVQTLQKKLESYRKNNPKMTYPPEIKPFLY